MPQHVALSFNHLHYVWTQVFVAHQRHRLFEIVDVLQACEAVLSAIFGVFSLVEKLRQLLQLNLVAFVRKSLNLPHAAHEKWSYDGSYAHCCQ